MHVRESDYCRITVVVAGTPVPVLRDAGRSELNQSERNIGSDKDMAMPAGTDTGINILRIVRILSASEKEYRQNYKDII